ARRETPTLAVPRSHRAAPRAALGPSRNGVRPRALDDVQQAGPTDAPLGAGGDDGVAATRLPGAQPAGDGTGRPGRVPAARPGAAARHRPDRRVLRRYDRAPDDRAAAHLLRPAARRSGEHGRTPLQCVCRRTITGVPDLGPRLRSLWTATGVAHRAAGIGDRLFDFRIRQRSLAALRVSFRAR